jgi:hypothetical protein
MVGGAAQCEAPYRTESPTLPGRGFNRAIKPLY